MDQPFQQSHNGRLVSVVVTDVVDSTKLFAMLGDARSAELWERHDNAARDVLARFDGRELERTDGLVVLFEDPVDATGFAEGYHAALGALDPPLRARVGIHRGPMYVRSNTPEQTSRGANSHEADGISLPAAARVASVANPEQTLLTRAAVPPGLSVVSHGHWQLKGVPEPVEIFELTEDAGRSPVEQEKAYRVARKGDLWIPAREIPHSLPSEPDAFVGRAAELGRLDELVKQHRLVTVLGIAGIGKTRLARRFGWSHLGDFPGGVWFCDLAEARTPEGIAYQMATALGIQLGKQDLVVQIGHALASRGRTLVILDTCEHIVNHRNDVLRPWIERASQAVFVATSRALLHLPGEAVLTLEPLQDSDSVQLFGERAAAARGARPGPLDNPDDAQAVADLVALLDRLPLAIELAAARARILSPRMLLAKMDERFRLLAAQGGRAERHLGLRAALDWSWDLLDEAQKLALAQVSVFEGSFDVDAAEAVLEVPGSHWTLDLLQSLVDNSLVVARPDGRFEQLLTVLEYGRARLDEIGAEPTQRRHFHYFAKDDPGRESGERWVLDIENLIAAHERALAAGDGDRAARVARSAWTVFARRGPYSSGLSMLEASFALPVSEPALRVWLRLDLANARALLGRLNGVEQLQTEALEEARALGDAQVLGAALNQVGIWAFDRGENDAAMRALLDAKEHFVQAGDAWREGQVLASIGRVHHRNADLPAARRSYEGALALHRQTGNGHSEAVVLGYLAALSKREEKVAEARRYLETAIELQTHFEDLRQLATLENNLGNLLWPQGELHQARDAYERALARFRSLGDRRGEGQLLVNLGVVFQELGETRAASATYERAFALNQELGNRLGAALAQLNQGELFAEEGRLEEARARFEASRSLLSQLSGEPPPRVAGYLEGRFADLALREGRLDDAERHLTEGERLLEKADLGELAKLQEMRKTLAKRRAEGT